MRLPTVDEVVTVFEEAGVVMQEATLSGDYRKNNRQRKKLEKYYKLYAECPELCHACIDRLIESENVVTRTNAAACSIAFDYELDRAKAVLQDIASARKDIFGFNAEMTLKVWKKQGYLDFGISRK